MSQQTTWVVDPAHTVVEFAVKHMMIATVKGRFSDVQGTLTGDPTDLTTATIQATINVQSIDTREQQRDDHLRSADFFDAANHPVITFVSRRISRRAQNEYDLAGDLTIRGTTREVALTLTFDGQARDPWGNERAAFTIEGKLNRKDYGLNWNTVLEAGGVLVGEEVKLFIQAQVIRQ